MHGAQDRLIGGGGITLLEEHHVKRSWAPAVSALSVAATLLLGAVPPAQADLLVSSGNSVLRFDGTTGASLGNFVAPGSGGLGSAGDLTYGPDGKLYIGDLGNFTKNIKKYDGTTGAFLSNFVTDTGLPFFHIGFGPDANLYTYELLGVAVARYNGTTGAPLGSFTSGALVIGSGGFAFGTDGNLYASTAQSSLSPDPGVDVFNGTTGVFIRELTGVSPGSLTFGPDGNLYVAASSQVLRYDAMAGTFSPFASGGGLMNPGELAFGPDGNLYVGSTNSILRYDGKTGTFLSVFVPVTGSFTFTPSVAPVPEPGGLALLAMGIVSLVTYGWRPREQPK